MSYTVKIDNYDDEIVFYDDTGEDVARTYMNIDAEQAQKITLYLTEAHKRGVERQAKATQTRLQQFFVDNDMSDPIFLLKLYAEFAHE